MGAILSRPVNYIKQKINQKVEDTKATIRTKIDNTKNAIYTKIDNTKNAIYTRIENTKNAITTRITDSATAVVTRVTDSTDAVITHVTDSTNAVVTRVTKTRDAVVSRVKKVTQGVVDLKDGVVTRVTNVGTAVKAKYTATKDVTISAYTTVKTRCINTKNAVQTRYRNIKKKTIDTYQRIRHAKLTRWQKVKYGSLLLFILVWLLIWFVILLDLYLGDYKGAQWKVEAVKAFWCYVGAVLLEMLTSILQCIKLGAKYSWEGTKIGADYTWAGMKVCGVHLWDASVIGAEYTAFGSRVCGEYMLYGTTVCIQSLSRGLSVGADHIAHGAMVGAIYTMEGAIVAFEYGSYGMKEGTVYLYEGTKSLLYNLAVGSYYAAIQLVRVTRMCVWGLLTGSYSGSAMVMDGTAFLANKTYHGSMVATNYTCIAVTKAWEWGRISATFINHWSIVGTQNLWQVTSESTIYIYESVIYGSINMWDSFWITYHFITNLTVITTDKVVTTTITVTTFTYEWGHYIIIGGSKGLYYGINQFGLKWLYSLSQSLAQLGAIIGNIFLKFFTDLGMYLWNFLYVTSMHIYNLFYIIFSFLYGILSGIMGLVRVNVDGIVYCVKLVFRGIIFVLEKILMGYYYMLDKYNNYREWLFLAFIALITLYCTGLIRDRRQSYGSDTEDDEEENDSGDAKGKPKKRKGSDLPPIYERPELPDYQDSSEDELLFDADNVMNLENTVESDEADLEEESHLLKVQQRAKRISVGQGDSDGLSDDSLETPSGESDHEKTSSSAMSSSAMSSCTVTGEQTFKHARSPYRSRKAYLEAEEADDEEDLSDNDFDPESLSDGEPEKERFDAEGRPLYDRVAALIRSPGSENSSRVSTPGSIDSPGTPASDFFAGHDLQDPADIGSPASGTEGVRPADAFFKTIEAPVGDREIPASDFFVGDLITPDRLSTPASGIGTPDSDFFAGHHLRAPSRDFGTPASGMGTPDSDFFAGHHLRAPNRDFGTPASGMDTPDSDFFAGHHLTTPSRNFGTPASGMDTPDSDFFAGHHLQAPSRNLGTPASGIDTPDSDFFVGHHLGTPRGDLEQRGQRIFEHGLEGQSDLDSLEAVPVSDSDPDSPVKSIRRNSLKKRISKNLSSISDEESGDADCESDPETERTLKERVAAIKSRQKGYKDQLLSTHVDDDNVESPMSPTSPISPGSVDDNQSCDTDSLQNLLASDSSNEANDSLRMSDDLCEDSLGDDNDAGEDVMSTDSIPAGSIGTEEEKEFAASPPMMSPLVTSQPKASPLKHNFDNQRNLNAIFDKRSELLAKEISASEFDDDNLLVGSVDNQMERMSVSGATNRGATSLEGTTPHLSTSDNGNNSPSTDH